MKQEVTITHSFADYSNGLTLDFVEFAAEVNAILAAMPDESKLTSVLEITPNDYYFSAEVRYTRLETDEEYAERLAADIKFEIEKKRRQEKAIRLKEEYDRAEYARLKAKYE